MIRVFQCATCRTIVSDSFDLIQELKNDEKVFMIFQELCQGRVRQESNSVTINDHDAPDFECTYIPLSCTRCLTKIGRTYTVTNDALENVRGLSCLETGRLLCYTLNEKQSKIDVEQSDLDLKSEVKRLKQDMAKMQMVIVKLASHVFEIEK